MTSWILKLTLSFSSSRFFYMSKKSHDKNLKLVSAIFNQMFIFNQMIVLQKLWKMRYSTFVFPSSRLFLPVNHCVRGFLKINLIVYDVTNCLNKNLVTHCAWYLGKEKRYGNETLSTDRVLNNVHFYGKIMQKMRTKKSTLFFLPNPVPVNVQSYRKQKGPGTSDQSFFRLRNKFRKNPLLVIYYMTKFDDVIQTSCWVISKITSANLCKPIHDI